MNKLNKRINKIFLRIHKFIFGLFILNAIGNILLDIAQKPITWQIIKASLFELWPIIKFFYLPIAGIIFGLEWLILKTHLQIYLYYHIWLRYIFRSLKKMSLEAANKYIYKFSGWFVARYFNEYYSSLILHSWLRFRSCASANEAYPIWLQKKSYKGKPVFIRREHIADNNFWPNWAFSTVVLFNELKLVQFGNKRSPKFCLEVDLYNQSYGIYNNAGKDFLRDKFLKGKKTDSIYFEQAKKVEKFLRGEALADKLVINASDTPLRWVSGGVLPIAYWKGQYWFVLFFRGISPVGWNVANGASESEEEYKNLRTLMIREFSEELILLDREPQVNDSSLVVQKVFRLPTDIFEEYPKLKAKIRSQSFIERHNDIRKKHDNLTILAKEGPKIKILETPFEIKISDDKEPREADRQPIENILLSVNPLEFGIESIASYVFKMDDDDYFLFGEIWEVADCLLREPIMLLSCDYIQEVFKKNGGNLGKHILKVPYLDCKSLEKIPKDKYHIFDKDIDFRKRRKSQIVKGKLDTQEIKDELELHKRWLKNYEKFFKNLQKEKSDIRRDKGGPLSRLCPVTWKTLELVCQYNLLKQLPKKL